MCRHSNVEKRNIFSVNCSTWQIQRADKPKHEQHNFDFILIFIGYLSQQLKQIYIWKGLVELFKIRLLDGNVSVLLRNNAILDTLKSKTSYELISWNSIQLMIKKNYVFLLSISFFVYSNFEFISFVSFFYVRSFSGNFCTKNSHNRISAGDYELQMFSWCFASNDSLFSHMKNHII